MHKESFTDGTIEDALELAYWKYDQRRATHKNGESERMSFKHVVRQLIADRPLVEGLRAGPVIKIAGPFDAMTGTAVCLHVSATYDSSTGKTTCNHCKQELYGGATP